MTFQDFPDMGNGLRLVGSTLLDEEQFSVEQWHDYRGEMRPTVEGIRRYAQIRKSRREERHSSWKARVDAEDAYSEEINQQLDTRLEEKPDGR